MCKADIPRPPKQLRQLLRETFAASSFIFRASCCSSYTHTQFLSFFVVIFIVLILVQGETSEAFKAGVKSPSLVSSVALLFGQRGFRGLRGTRHRAPLTCAALAVSCLSVCLTLGMSL